MDLQVNEVKLCLYLMLHGEEVPPNIKDKAVDMLKTASMMIPSEEMDAYLMDRLVKAVEEDDIEELHKVSEMIGVAYGIDERDDDDDREPLEPTPEIEAMINQAVDGFVAAFEETIPRAVLYSSLERINKSLDIIPLRFQDGMLICVDQRSAGIVVYSVNSRETLVEVVNKFDRVDKVSLHDAIRKQWNPRQDIEVRFQSLRIREMTDDSFELRSFDLSMGGEIDG